jgi:hypothetical protein
MRRRLPCSVELLVSAFGPASTWFAVLERLHEQRCKRGRFALPTAEGFRKAAVVIALINFIRMVVQCEERFLKLQCFSSACIYCDNCDDNNGNVTCAGSFSNFEVARQWRITSACAWPLAASSRR